jgi:hypothetical protein
MKQTESRAKRHIPPKRLLTFNGLQGVIFHKTEIFITTAVKTLILHNLRVYHIYQEELRKITKHFRINNLRTVVELWSFRTRGRSATHPIVMFGCVNERPPLLGEVVPTFADKGYRLVSATDPHGCILGFLDRSRYYFYQEAPQLYSRG